MRCTTLRRSGTPTSLTESYAFAILHSYVHTKLLRGKTNHDVHHKLTALEVQVRYPSARREGASVLPRSLVAISTDLRFLRTSPSPLSRCASTSTSRRPLCSAPCRGRIPPVARPDGLRLRRGSASTERARALPVQRRRRQLQRRPAWSARQKIVTSRHRHRIWPRIPTQPRPVSCKSNSQPLPPTRKDVPLVTRACPSPTRVRMSNRRTRAPTLAMRQGPTTSPPPQRRESETRARARPARRHGQPATCWV